jgi:hypothetical protein
MSADGKGGRHIRSWLEDNKVLTRKNKHISLSMIYKILNNTFYYGVFEYPAGSGKWYKGNHEPMISKENKKKELEEKEKIRTEMIKVIKSKLTKEELKYIEFK